MSSAQAALEAVIEQFRPGFQSDGADLRLDSFAEGVAHVSLIYGPNACVECVLPPDALAEHLLALIRDDAPDVSEIVVKEERPA